MDRDEIAEHTLALLRKMDAVHNEVKDGRTENRQRFARIEARITILDEHMAGMMVLYANHSDELGELRGRIESRLELSD